MMAATEEVLTPLQMLDELIGRGGAGVTELAALREAMAPRPRYNRHVRRSAWLFDVNDTDVPLSEKSHAVMLRLAALQDGEFLSFADLRAVAAVKHPHMLVLRLRQVLARAGATVQCVRGRGYRLVDISGENHGGEEAGAIGAGAVPGDGQCGEAQGGAAA